MHDVTLHFGDIIKSWATFSPLETGIAFKLMLRYYDKEGPLPNDDELLQDAIGCTHGEDRKSKAEREAQIQALHKVLRLKYTLVNGAWIHRRTDTEIRRYRHRCRINAYNNLQKIAKNKPDWILPSFDDFAEHFEHYYDTDLKRFQNLSKSSQSNPTGEPPPTESAPKVSESETIGVPKTPNSGTPTSHFPLPTSHFPYSQEDTPIVPKGDVSPEFDDPESSGEPTTLDPPPAPRKKKKGPRLRIEDLTFHDECTPQRRQAITDWVAYKAERGQGYVARGYAALLTTLSSYSDTQVIAAIRQAMANGWAGIFPDKIELQQGPKKEGAPWRPQNESMPTPAPLASETAPENWERAWAAKFSAIPCPGTWDCLPPETRATLRSWLHHNPLP